LLIIKRLTERVWSSRAVFAVVLFGWNPVALFHSVASGHNDVLVGLCIVGGLALLQAKHDLLATAALTLGTAIKVSAALPLLLLVVVAIASVPRASRLRIATKHVGVAAGVWLVLAAP
jgi:Gpi18-like mannosyltransferase